MLISPKKLSGLDGLLQMYWMPSNSNGGGRPKWSGNRHLRENPCPTLVIELLLILLKCVQVLSALETKFRGIIFLSSLYMNSGLSNEVVGLALD